MSDAKPVTAQKYWNALWGGARPLAPIDPHRAGLRNYANRHLHLLFAAALADGTPRGKRLIELGCGGSRWLGYFQQIHGCVISGIDYSPQGCAVTQALLDRMGISGNIMEGDLFNPPTDQLNAYDFVFSNGLIEHFSGTAEAVRAAAAFLKPGGAMITLVPNMTGPLGWLQKFFDRALYQKHVPLNREQLAAAHREAGLEIIASEYALLAHLGVIQFGALERVLGSRPLQVIKIALSAPLWVLGPVLGLKPNAVTSPFVLCLSRKPG